MEAERYTVKYCADQLLLQPDCPVHVKKMQCTRDNLTGTLFLQIRYVNRDSRTVEGLVIRICLLDVNGREVAAIRALPVSGLHAAQHQCFGDDKTVVLPQESCDIRVLVDQVQFTDGYLWRNKPEAQPMLLHPPVKVCGKVQPCRYDGYWYCACGMVNPDSAAACGYCGAPSPVPAAQPEPAPVAAEPVPAVQPAPQVLPAPPVPAAPAAPEPECYVFPTPPIDAIGYLPVSPLTQPPEPAPPTPQQFPVITAPTPAPAESPRKSHTAVWVLLLLLLLVGIAAAAYFFGYPLYRYYQANQLQAQGNYAEAIAAYEALGNYDNAQEQIAECRFLLAEDILQHGDFSGAYTAFLELSDDPRAPEMLLECLHQMCLDAMGHGDLELTTEYLAAARKYLPAQPPTWYTDATAWQLYQRGVRAFSSGDYTLAITYFQNSALDDYEEQISACQYAQAGEMMQEKRYSEAVDAYAALGDFSDSHDQMLSAMHAYVLANYTVDDVTTLDYLQTMLAENVTDARKLYDELYVWSVSFVCNNSSSATLTVKDLSELVISYKVDSGHMDGGTLDLTLEYTLPNGKTGSLVFARGLRVGDSGEFHWKDASNVTDKTDGKLLLVIRQTGADEVLWRRQVTIKH